MLHSDCVKKILALGQPSGVGLPNSVAKGLLEAFIHIIMDCEDQNLPSGTLVVPFYDENTDPSSDDWVAELHFVVRRGDIDEEANSSGDSETEEV